MVTYELPLKTKFYSGHVVHFSDTARYKTLNRVLDCHEIDVSATAVAITVSAAMPSVLTEPSMFI